MKLFSAVSKKWKESRPQAVNQGWGLVLRHAKGFVIPISGYQIFGGKKWSISFLVMDSSKTSTENDFYGPVA